MVGENGDQVFLSFGSYTIILGGVIDRLMPMIGLKPAKTKWDTQIAGAAGAALFGYAVCQKGKGRKK